MTRIDLTDEDHFLPVDEVMNWSAEERKHAERLCRLSFEDKAVRLTAIRHRAGHVQIKGVRILSRSSIPSRILLQMVLYAGGLSLNRQVGDLIDAAESDTGADDAEELVAQAMTVAARQLRKRTIAQQYVRRTEVLTALRGRPHWHHVAVAPPGVRCSFHEKQTDNPLNQTVLSGLIIASTILRSASCGIQVREELHIWRELSSSSLPKRSRVDAQVRGLDQLTSPYRISLVLARCLLFGPMASDFLSNSGEVPFPGLVFDLGFLFENVLSRLLSDSASNYGVVVDSQRARGDAILDSSGATYKAVRPDIVVRRDGWPILVVDAKFKPQYLRCPPGTRSPVSKVGNDDLYQLFFYQQHLQRGNRLPSAAIVAPKFSEVVPDRRFRELHVESPSGDTLGSVNLIAADLDALFTILCGTAGAADAIAAAAPELDGLLQRPPVAGDRC